MATLYYNNGDSDNDWNNLNNWWNDSAYTISATSLPVNGDIVYIDGELVVGPSTPVVLNSIISGSIYNTSPFNVNFGDASTGGSYFFYGSVNHAGTTVYGSFYFNDSSSNSGLVDSNNQTHGFYDNSINQGDAYNDIAFFDNSTNNGTCYDNASFHNTSYNLGTVVGNATFYTFNDLGGGSYEDTLGFGTGTVNGDVAGSGTQLYSIQYVSNNMNGNITAVNYSFDVSFTNTTTNNGTIDIAGGAGFTDSSSNEDTVVGDAAFSNTSYNGAAGSVGGNAFFYNTSYNIGTVTGNATFNYVIVNDGIADDITGYSSGVVNGVVYGGLVPDVITTWRFNTDLNTNGTCQGNAIFNGFNHYNNGTVTGDSYFYEGSINGNVGVVQGTTYIYDTGYNIGTVEDIVYKSSDSVKNSLKFGYTGTVNGTVSLPFADILGTGLQ